MTKISAERHEISIEITEENLPHPLREHADYKVLFKSGDGKHRMSLFYTVLSREEISPLTYKSERPSNLEIILQISFAFWIANNETASNCWTEKPHKISAWYMSRRIEDLIKKRSTPCWEYFTEVSKSFNKTIGEEKAVQLYSSLLSFYKNFR